MKKTTMRLLGGRVVKPVVGADGKVKHVLRAQSMASIIPTLIAVLIITIIILFCFIILFIILSLLLAY